MKIVGFELRGPLTYDCFMGMNMKISHFLTALKLCVLSVAVSLPAFAQNKPVACPAIIANKNSKLYQTKSGLVCFSKASAAKKAGFNSGSIASGECPSPTPTPVPSAPVNVTSVSVLDSIEMSEIEYRFSRDGKKYPKAGNTYRAYLVEIVSDYSLECSTVTSSFFSVVLSDGSEVKAFGNPNDYTFPGNRLGWSSEFIPTKESRRGWIVFEVPQTNIPKQIAFLVMVSGTSFSDRYKYVAIP